MQSILKVAVVAVVAAFGTTAVQTDAFAAKTAYSAKKAECKERAKAMKFGIHIVKKNRWVKDCVAGAH
jgi:hypothetical protein